MNIFPLQLCWQMSMVNIVKIIWYQICKTVTSFYTLVLQKMLLGLQRAVACVKAVLGEGSEELLVRISGGNSALAAALIANGWSPCLKLNTA